MASDRQSHDRASAGPRVRRPYSRPTWEVEPILAQTGFCNKAGGNECDNSGPLQS